MTKKTFTTNTMISMLLALALVPFFGACSNNGHVASSAIAHGTGDGGGGNVYKGKPLESYIVDPHNLAGFNEVVTPVITKIVSANSSLGSLLNYWILTRKKWYLLPGPLNKLPSDKIGSAVPTDQGALQDFDQLWIDSDKFNDPKTTDADRGKLLLHEILMGIKLMRFESRFNQCESIYHLDEENGDSQMCKESPLPAVRLGSPKDLTPQDYDEIRATVAELMQLPATPNWQDISDIFSRNNFSFQWFYFDSKTDFRKMTAEQFTTALRTAQLTHNWPNQLYAINDIYKIFNQNTGQLSGKWSSIGSCQLDQIAISSDQIDLTLSIKKSNEALARKIKINLPFNPSDPSCFEGNMLDKSLGFILGVSSDDMLGTSSTGVVPLCEPLLRQNLNGQKLSVGDKNRLINFHFNGLTLEAIDLNESVIVQYSASPFSLQESGTNDGDNYLCGVHTSYTY